MNSKFYLIALFLVFSFLANAQWSTPDANGIYYTGKVRIGTNSTTDRTLLVYNATTPFFGVKNDIGSFDVGVAYNTGDFTPGARPGDASIKLHGTNHGLWINMNDNNNDGLSYIKFAATEKVIMAIYNNSIVKIDGKLFAKEIEVMPTITWPDYVFKPDYKLMPLEELESFIKENNHLPNIPTEAEVKTDGMNVAEMNAKLLQKVEELTLYVIDQQKQIEELKRK